MFDITLKNYRSFRSAGPATIRPFTILVGENSTGKSSFLGILRIALEMVGERQPNFNSDPFFLGAYDQIAHYRGGRGGRSPSFEFELSAHVTHGIDADLPSSFTMRYGAEFIKSFAQPIVNALWLSAGDYSFRIDNATRENLKFFLESPSWRGEIPEKNFELFKSYIGNRFLGIENILMLLAHVSSPDQRNSGDRLTETAIRDLQRLERMWSLSRAEFGPPPFAVAPVRTRPERTYNPIEERHTSEGSHVPMVMAKIYFTDRDQWASLQSSLNRFSKASGLYDQISLKPLGRSPSDPFQIMIKMAGPRSNMIDVGYGVSQVLPIVVDLLSSRTPLTYLLQQPEIHLHPRGQSELASFLGSIIKNTKNWVIMETHSDYIVDRIRSDIRDKKGLTSLDVSILFLDRIGIETSIHQIGIDDDGNLVNVPDNYRKFTMEEERRLLGIDDTFTLSST